MTGPGPHITQQKSYIVSERSGEWILHQRPHSFFSLLRLSPLRKGQISTLYSSSFCRVMKREAVIPSFFVSSTPLFFSSSPFPSSYPIPNYSLFHHGPVRRPLVGERKRNKKNFLSHLTWLPSNSRARYMGLDPNMIFLIAINKRESACTLRLFSG